MIKTFSREQGIPLGVAAIIFVGAGVGGWFGVSGLMEKLEQAHDVEQRKGSGEVSPLMARPGGIAAARKETEEMAQLARELAKQDEALIDPWRKGWEEATGAGADWSKDAGKWKDKLVNDNDEVLKKCGPPGDRTAVSLGDNFYLGLEEYKQKSPSGDQVPTLARELSVAKRLVDLLISAKKTREGYATPCVLQELVVPWTGEGAPEEVPVKKAPAEKNMETLRERYRLRISCSPEVLYEYVRLLQQDRWLFIIHDLRVTNEREMFPKRKEIGKLFETEPPPVGGSPEQGATRVRGQNTAVQKLLLVLSGKERLEVNLDIDYIGWKPLPVAEKSSEARK